MREVIAPSKEEMCSDKVIPYGREKGKQIREVGMSVLIGKLRESRKQLPSQLIKPYEEFFTDLSKEFSEFCNIPSEEVDTKINNVIYGKK